MGGVTASPPDRALIIYAPTSTPPVGYLKANGAVISRSAYSWLFGKIGTTFGAGDGSTTFAIPDLRGEFIRGFDDGRGADSGRGFGSYQAGQNESHNHYVSTATETNNTNAGYVYPALATGTGPVYTSSSGGGEARPRNVALLACIAYAP